MNQTIALPVRVDVGESVKLKDKAGTVAIFTHIHHGGRRDPDVVVAFARRTATALNHFDKAAELLMRADCEFAEQSMLCCPEDEKLEGDIKALLQSIREQKG